MRVGEEEEGEGGRKGGMRSWAGGEKKGVEEEGADEAGS